MVILVIMLEVTTGSVDEIRSWNISVLGVGSFGYCSYFVRDDNMKRLTK